MQDLTEGPIGGHLIRMALPIGIGMMFQTLYYLVDIYFVAQLGDAAIAGVSAAGNLQYLVMALAQVLGVGTMALISHASGRKDRQDANLIFNQSLSFAALCLLITLGFGYALADWYMQKLGADQATIDAGVTFLFWFLPGLGLQFALVSMGSALRGTGIVKPTIIVQVLTVILNAILCPILISGWLTGHPLGVVGAGLATSLSVLVAVIMMWIYFIKLERFVSFDKGLMTPLLKQWKRILTIGLPPGGEFALMFLFMAFIYWIAKDFGADAQAGYGIGSRVMQAIFLPAMAIAFATAPVAGQNMGANKPERVRETFKTAVIWLSGLMLVLTLLCQIAPSQMITFFTEDQGVITAGGDFLRIISFTFVATGIVFTCSGMFQALGNTLPSLLASASRIISFILPSIWMAQQSWFQLQHLWYWSVITVAMQAALAWVLLNKEMAKRLTGETVMKEQAPR
jgi:putative MATE family efflux protein